MKEKKMMMSPRKKRGIKYLLITIPYLIFIFAFCYAPLFGWGYAFVEYRAGFPIWKSEFVGLKYFTRLFTDKETFRILRNTLVMSFLGILTSPLPVFSAILINEVRNTKIKKVVQTVTTLPNFISWVIIYGLAFSFFSNSGLINQILGSLGLPTSEFGLIGDVRYTWTFMLLLGIWKGLGWNSIIYLAAITGLDPELYDAAKVDGANKLQLIRHITIPGIIPTYLVLLLLEVSNILSNGFEKYYMFWNSLVADKIEVLDYYIYKVGFTNGRYSYGIAIGMMKSLIAIALLFMVNFISKKLRGNSIF